MDEEEVRAREICAYCNWVADCNACRELLCGKLSKKPRFSWEKCRDWVNYRKIPTQKLKEKLALILQSLLRRICCLLQELLFKVGDILFHD